MVDEAEEKVVLELTKSEALVLFEFLARTSYDEVLKTMDSAERRALWKLEGQLESTLVEPFLPNYLELVERAKRRLKEDQIGFEEN